MPLSCEDLQPGDLVLFKINGELFHVAIFDSEEDRVSNLNEIMANVFNNAEFFEDLGALDTKNLSRKSFDKESYREEQRQDAIATEGLKTF